MSARSNNLFKALMVRQCQLVAAIALGTLTPLAIAQDQQNFCGAASQFTVPSDLANVEGDLSLEHVVKAPASMTVCAYGYWAEKCGDHVTANLIFDKCIAAGYVGAMIWKGLLYEDGNGVAQDSSKAVALFQRAAQSGNSDYATLGKLHYATALHLGKGIARDEVEARKWFQAAADEGDPDAETFLRTGHHTGARDSHGNGVGVPAEAVRGQKLERQPSPAVDSTPLWLGILLAVTFAAGCLRQMRRLAMPARC